jgi:hypothetical protein
MFFLEESNMMLVEKWKFATIIMHFLCLLSLCEPSVTEKKGE